MRPIRIISLMAAPLALAVCSAALSAQDQQQPVRGFPADALPALARNEAALRAVPNADSLRARMRRLAEEPHEAGTERSRRVAEHILQRLRSFGLDAEIERFEALMPRPVARTLELIAPNSYKATLAEPPVAGDKDSDDANQIPTFNAYSPDGDVTAELVFVNYGLPEDYRILDSLGIDVEGKIVIAKYGRSWRGIKPKLAAEHGAVGCIIYSDPKDDGYFVDDVYTDGPMRPWLGVQRGSVMDMPTYPGDPLTPGWGAVEGARKLAIEDAVTLEDIPVLPVSYADALPFLRNLEGPVAPESWRGALPITYHIGPGPARVHLALEFDWDVRPLYNVIARVSGKRSPDQWIIYGNHHDAWVNGAEDPISGMVALEETARAVGTLLRTGWRPERTIVFAAWDGEEWGLLGSVEWAELHAEELRDKAVAYLNSDTNGRGWLGVSGSHSLQMFMQQVARDIRDPVREMSVLDAVMQRRRERASEAAEPATPQPVTPDSANLPPGQRAEIAADTAAGPDTAAAVSQADADTGYTIGALGSGSDYTAFIDHLGLASLNISYGGEANDGIYHSIYDSFDFYTRFLDTTFVYGVLEARTTGTAIMRLADAPVLPFEFGSVAATYREYVEEIGKESKKNDTTAALDLSGVSAALDRLVEAAARYDSALARLEGMSAADVDARWQTLEPVNELLYRTERALTDPAGLPGRDWFRHLIYAPGFYTGYGVKTMPGIREAVEDRPDLDLAQSEAARVASAIDRFTADVSAAAEQLTRALR